MPFIVTSDRWHLLVTPGDVPGTRRVAWVRHLGHASTFPSRSDAQEALDQTITLTPNRALSAKIEESGLCTP